MPWYAWAVIIYLAIDRLGTVLVVNRWSIDITPAFAFTSLITGGLMVWAIVELAA